MINGIEQLARAGALNLLQGCVGVASGDRLLLVESDGTDGYDPAVAAFVATVAEELGCHVLRQRGPASVSPDDFPAALARAMSEVDHTIFFARIGDQFRFQGAPEACTKTMTYVLSLELMAAGFSRVPHGLMVAVLDRLTRRIADGGAWRITCPLGSDISSSSLPFSIEEDAGDFQLRLFPIGIFRPLDAATMNGRLVTRWINATLNRHYEPEGFVLDEPVTLSLKAGRIDGFEGPNAERVAAHFDHVASLFDIDGGKIFSWHAGIHPKTVYDGRMVDSFSRWGSVAFNSPRYTHLHTCGDEPPGEVSPVLIDATITFDGEVLWRDGRFVYLDRPEIAALRDDYGQAEDAFTPCREIGL
ncbi:MAG: hypothetical protein AAF563_24370 [Pseudomonadota bacterium]